MISDFAHSIAEYAVLTSGVAGPINAPVARGEIVLILRRPSWKLGVVLGPSRTPGKMRVCLWIATSRRYNTSVRAISNADIAAIVDTVRFTTHQRAVYKAARAKSKELRQ